MSCECKKAIEGDEQGLVAKHVAKAYRGAAVEKAELAEVTFPIIRGEGGIRLTMVTYNNLRTKVSGRVKPVNITIMHSFCPFCGKKYDDTAEEVLP